MIIPTVLGNNQPGINEMTGTSLERSTTCLADLLSNTLILAGVVAYLSPAGITKLSTTSQGIREIIIRTRGVFRHLELKTIKAVQFDLGTIEPDAEAWSHRDLDQSLTEDE